MRPRRRTAGLLFLVAALMASLLAPGAASGAAPEGSGPGAPDIVGGSVVSPPGSYPFIVLVYPGPYLCGGALVADDWVLTAAHCTVGIPASNIDVVVGRHRQSGTSGEEIPVAAKYEHPNYGTPFGSSNDVTLLQLSRPATAGSPIALAGPGDAALFAPGTMATVAGWGTTSQNGNASDALREADVPIVSDAECADAYSGPSTGDFEAASMLCAGYPSGGIDSCQGDSGGPLFVPNGSGYLHVGVVSWGEGCARPGFPGVYAETAALYSWIASVVGFQGGQPPGRPRNLSAAAGDGRVELSWLAPQSAGSDPISDYLVQWRPAGGNWWRDFDDGVSAARSAAVTGLSNGREYEFRVSAVNAAGSGPWSATAAATPVAGAAGKPGRPRNLAAAPGSRAVQLSWDPPASDGGAPIRDYVVQFRPAGAQAWQVFDDGWGPGTSATVTGLTNDMSYQFKVAARNTEGRGPWSAWAFATPVGGLSNDMFADAIELTGAAGTVTGSNVGATLEPGEPSHAWQASHSVWWTWTAPFTGTVVFDTHGSGFDTVLAVYWGPSVDSLREIVSNDDLSYPGTLTSEVVFQVTAGGRYRIAVDGYGDETGAIVLTWLLQ